MTIWPNINFPTLCSLLVYRQVMVLQCTAVGLLVIIDLENKEMTKLQMSCSMICS